jgi:prephenate dehydrogenase
MRIGIIGLGLIGGSIGMAIKKAGWRNAEVVGYVRRSNVGTAALDMGAVDRVEGFLKDTVAGADLVIIATPIMTVKTIFEEISPYLPLQCIVTDAASTKRRIMDWADELLPPEVIFVGGHPMAGKETSGIAVAEAELFRDKVYCLTEGPRSDTKAVELLEDMIRAMGAKPLRIDAAEHDRLVAGISHLPMLLSVALVSTTMRHPSWHQLATLASSGYRDLTRLASGSPDVNGQICESNSDAIVTWIDEFIMKLEEIRSSLTDDGSDLNNILDFAVKARKEWFEKSS